MSSLGQLHLQNLGKSIDQLELYIQQYKDNKTDDNKQPDKSAHIQVEINDIQQIIDMIRLDNKNTLTTQKERIQFRKYVKCFKQLKQEILPQNSEIIIEMGPIETPDNLIAYGQAIMQQDTKSAQNMISVLQNTKDIGVSTAQKLAEQTEQIDKMQDNLHAIDSELDRAKVVIRRIGRGMAQSKSLWCMIGLIVMSIIAVIILKLK